MTADDVESLTTSVFEAAAVERVPELRAAAETIAATATDATDPARVLAVAAGAWLVAYKLAFDRGDLDRATIGYRTAYEHSPTPCRASNLASCLLELTDFDGNRNRFAEALTLLDVATSDPEATIEISIRRRSNLLVARIDACERELAPVDLAALVVDAEDLHREAVNAGVPDSEIANLCTSALSLAAHDPVIVAADPGVLDRSLHYATLALAALDDRHPDLGARHANLSTVHLRRYEVLGGKGELTAAVSHLDRALATTPPNHPTYPLLLNNAVNTAVAWFEHTGEFEIIENYIDLARSLPDRFPAEHPLKPTAFHNAALLLRSAAHNLHRRELLDDCLRLHVESVTATEHNSPQRSSRLAGLALALSDDYHHTRDPQRLDDAIEIASAALADVHPVDLIGFKNNLAMMRHDRFLRTGDFDDLEAAIELDTAVLNELPTTHHDHAVLRTNAAVVLFAHYNRSGQLSNLRRAIEHIGGAIEASVPGDPNRWSRKINRASMLHAASEHDAAPVQGLDEAEVLLRETLGQGHLPGDERRIATETLVDVLRSRWAHRPDDALVEEMALLDSPTERSDRPNISLRRAFTAGLQGRRDLEDRHLRDAVETGQHDQPAVALFAARSLVDAALQNLDAGTVGRRDTALTVAHAAQIATTICPALHSQAPSSTRRSPSPRRHPPTRRRSPGHSKNPTMSRPRRIDVVGLP